MKIRALLQALPGIPLTCAAIVACHHQATTFRAFFLASALLSAAVAWGLALPLLGAGVLAFVSERPTDFILVKLRREKDVRVR